jgi:YD repeat-containing protein
VQGLGATSNPTWQVFARYSYRDDGALISATDADGYTTVFEYDDQRRLIRYRDPVGVTTHYVYDAQSRCTETWVLGRPEQDPDPALAPHAPTTLADGTTPARGFFHARFDFDGDGDVAVTTSRVTRRYSGNPDGTINKVVSAGSVVTREYDQLGLESRVVDPLGATTIIARDESGNIIKWFDALGRTRQLRRDASGRVVAASDPLGATALFDRDLDGNVVRFVDFDERIFSFVWNQGLLA